MGEELPIEWCRDAIFGVDGESVMVLLVTENDDVVEASVRLRWLFGLQKENCSVLIDY